MKKQYVKPEVTAYGRIDALTQIFGEVSAGDALYDPNGNVHSTGNLSIDADPCGSQTNDPICGNG